MVIAFISGSAKLFDNPSSQIFYKMLTSHIAT